MTALRRLLFALLVAVLPGSAALAACGGGTVATSDLLGQIRTALDLERRLDGARGQAALLAVAATHPPRAGETAAHPALVWRDRDGGRWVVSRVHRACRGDGVHLADRGLMDYLASAPRGGTVTITRPAAAVQRALARIMRSGSARHLLDPRSDSAAADWLQAVVDLARAHAATGTAATGTDERPERLARVTQRRLPGRPRRPAAAIR